MGCGSDPLAAVQRRILVVAAVEDKRFASAETRLMSGGPRPRKVPSRSAVWRRSGATWALVPLSSVHCFSVSWDEGVAYD